MRIKIKMSEQKVKFIVRVLNTDLDGNKPIGSALRKIKGVGVMFANAVCITTSISPFKKSGLLSDEDLKKLNETIKSPIEFGIPSWILNRRFDPNEGVDRHIVSSDLDFIKSNDIKHMQKIKCYKGVRHGSKKTVRGQRTKSNFRRNKGKAASVYKTKTAQKK
jgi:small subunit ribosomal protein S13